MNSENRVTGRGPSAATNPTLNVIIETPKGSRNKFKFEPKQHLFKLSKILPQGMMFPFDFGFVPSTKAEDGDPLDVLVLIEEPTFPGCILECALIGVTEAEQHEQNGKSNRNDRLIAAARQSLLYSDLVEIDDLNETILKQIEAFFVNYQRLRNVEVEIISRQGSHRAFEIVQASRKPGRRKSAETIHLENLSNRGTKMATAKQRAAARKNIKKASAAAKRKHTLRHLPKATRTALGKQGAKVRNTQKRG
jgi:inorganic pyrophosphatase